MDIPFVSSGALSRSHYALVRKVETSQSSQLADQHLLDEVEAIRAQLARPTLTQKQCKECLILLLYCSTNVSSDIGMDLEFALHHAVNLAETGQTVHDKRIGYLFCAEIMPPDHELQLMLVNTLRKDMESIAAPRICLALDTLIHFSSEDVIPAIQSRLLDLLSYNSLHIRRRALFAFHKLARRDPSILAGIVTKAQKRLSDSEGAVVSAALTVCADLVKYGLLTSETFHDLLSNLLSSVWRQPHSAAKDWLTSKILSRLRTVTLSQHDLRSILRIIRSSSQRGRSGRSVLLQCYLTFAAVTPESIVQAQAGSKCAVVQEIRHLLTSEDPNDIYLFMSCLECIGPSLWAGTTPGIPAVLESWEVERIMHLLESNDCTIRRKTLRILQRVDTVILEQYYARMRQRDLTLHLDSDVLPQRMLEIIDVLCGEDGETYASQVNQIVRTEEGDAPLDKRPVLQGVVEDVLTRVRNGSDIFRGGCIGVWFTNVVDLENPLGSTLMVILAALITEYLGSSPCSPVDLLRGTSGRIMSYPVSIQDVCLLCMMRVAAECDDIPADVIDVVRSLHDRSGRYIRRRCDQFINFAAKKGALRDVVLAAKTATLPDFLAALEACEANNKDVHAIPQSSAPQTGRLSASKLRYDAYEPPKPSPRLRRMSNSSSRASDDGSSRFIGQGKTTEDHLSRTITAGDLTVAAGGDELEKLSSASGPEVTLPAVQIMDEDILATRVDLIAFDSPFMPEPAAALIGSHQLSAIDFEASWNKLEAYNSRGWCEMSLDEVQDRIRSSFRYVKSVTAEEEPFKGDMKIVVLSGTDSSNMQVAVLHLKQSDEDGTLWRMRCEHQDLAKAIKGLLSES